MRGVLIDGSAAAPASHPGSDAAVPFDPSLAWRRARSVALRPEPFGALVYHFGNRKLSFLKSRMLVAVVEALADHPSAEATLVACGVPETQRRAYVAALADLARSSMIERITSSPAEKDPAEKDPPAPHHSLAGGGTLPEGRSALAAGASDEADPEAQP